MSCSHIRLDRLRSVLQERSIDLFFVRDLSAIKWLTGFKEVFDDEPAHSMVIGPHDAVLHTDARYAHAFEAASQDTEICIDSQASTHAVFLTQYFEEAAVGQAEDLVLGIERTITLAEYRQIEEALAKVDCGVDLAETSSLILELRAVKDEEEITALKAAQRVTDAAFSYIISYMRPGMTEREVRIELEDYMLRNGAEGLAFPSIVATGANAANPHAVAGDRVLELGHAVVMDFGARVQGYCSDMTRTVFIGEPSARLKKAYAALRRTNEEIEEMLCAGLACSKAHARAEELLQEEGFGAKMGHSLGHGVGIEVHEEPRLALRSTAVLEVGNVVTVEPGIYFDGEFGMRLEDFGVISSHGFEVFTQSTHEIVII